VIAVNPLSPSCFIRAHGRQRRSAARRCRGFTIVELLTVVVIVGIMAALAAPGFANLMASIRASTAASDLYSALATARSEATKRNAEVTLASKSASTSWKDGWSIVDPASSTNVLLDRGGLIGAAVTGSLSSVVYQSSGRVKGSTKPTFVVAMTAGSTTITKNVCVDLSGRPFVSDSSCP